MTMAELIDQWRAAEGALGRATRDVAALRSRLRLALARTGPLRQGQYGGRIAFDGDEILFGGPPEWCPWASEVEVPPEPGQHASEQDTPGDSGRVRG